MGAKVSKLWDCLSMHDDLVADNDDVVAEAWYGARGVWGLPPRIKPLLPISSADVMSYKLVDIYDGDETFSCGEPSSRDLIPVGLQRANGEAVAAAGAWHHSRSLAEPAGGHETAQATDERLDCPAATTIASSFASSTMCCEGGPASGSNTSAAAPAELASNDGQQHGVFKQAYADNSSNLTTASTAVAPELTAGNAEAAGARSRAQGGTIGHCQQQPALASPTVDQSLELLEVPQSEKDAVTAAAAAARQKVEQMFANVDHKQQQQDKKQALAALAAARGPKPIVSAEEKQALQSAGKAAQEAANAKLATQLEEADAEMQQMSDDSRAQWFQENACQTTADAAAEVPFEDEWSSLPPEVLAMVQEMKSRK